MSKLNIRVFWGFFLHNYLKLTFFEINEEFPAANLRFGNLTLGHCAIETLLESQRLLRPLHIWYCRIYCS